MIRYIYKIAIDADSLRRKT